MTSASSGRRTLGTVPPWIRLWRAARGVLSTPAYVNPDRFGGISVRSEPAGRDRTRHHGHQVLDEGLVVEDVAGRPGGALLARSRSATARRMNMVMRLDRSSRISGGTAGMRSASSAVDLVATGAGEHRLELRAEARRVLPRQLGHDQQAGPTPPATRRQLGRRTDDRFDHRADVVVGGAPGLGQQLALALRRGTPRAVRAPRRGRLRACRSGSGARRGCVVQRAS